LQTECERRLLIVIARRLSTIRAAVKIACVAAGRDLEVGSHDKLMSREDGGYRCYVELQTSEETIA
tara:strand:- start:258 stop:455 length:198 start_codon:yes stop_codon:yes gene_type:complete